MSSMGGDEFKFGDGKSKGLERVTARQKISAAPLQYSLQILLFSFWLSSLMISSTSTQNPTSYNFPSNSNKRGSALAPNYLQSSTSPRRHHWGLLSACKHDVSSVIPGADRCRTGQGLPSKYMFPQAHLYALFNFIVSSPTRRNTMATTVTVDISEGIATITLNRPRSLNAITVEGLHP